MMNNIGGAYLDGDGRPTTGPRNGGWPPSAAAALPDLSTALSGSGQRLHVAILRVLLSLHPDAVRDIRQGRLERQPTSRDVPTALLSQLLVEFDREFPALLDVARAGQDLLPGRDTSGERS